MGRGKGQKKNNEVNEEKWAMKKNVKIRIPYKNIFKRLKCNITLFVTCFQYFHGDPHPQNKINE